MNTNETRRIPLKARNGEVREYALIDSGDYDLVSAYKWFLRPAGNGQYASASVKTDGKFKNIQMHRLIMNTPKGMDTDHINGDGLDNRRSNLQICTRAENVSKMKTTRKTASGYRGVYWHNQDKLWTVQLRYGDVYISGGYFKDKKDAALAYNEIAIKHKGKFAVLNKV